MKLYPKIVVLVFCFLISQNLACGSKINVRGGVASTAEKTDNDLENDNNDYSTSSETAAAITSIAFGIASLDTSCRLSVPIEIARRNSTDGFSVSLQSTVAAINGDAASIGDIDESDEKKIITSMSRTIAATEGSAPIVFSAVDDGGTRITETKSITIADVSWKTLLALPIPIDLATSPIPGGGRQVDFAGSSTLCSSSCAGTAGNITTGVAHSCALMPTGSIKCWGDNTYGQLGDGIGGAGIYSALPVDVQDGNSGVLTGVKMFNGKINHVCAVLTSGGVKCWGRGAFGRLGNNSTNDSLTPVDVWADAVGGTLANAVSVSLSANSSCALRTDGAVKCWGRNNVGQLGNNTWTDSLTPTDVLADATTVLTGVKALSSGLDFRCALMSDETVKCWGQGANNGELGNGASTTAKLPVTVWADAGGGTLTGVKALASGAKFTCGLMNNSGVKCWGRNDYGQLGIGLSGYLNGADAYRSTPVDVLQNDGSLFTGAVALAGGDSFMCAIMQNSTVKCWGYNLAGQLGNGESGDNVHSSKPVDVLGLDGAVAISGGDFHACVLRRTGEVKCWGKGDLGRLGNNSTSSSLSPVTVQLNAAGGSLAASKRVCGNYQVAP